MLKNISIAVLAVVAFGSIVYALGQSAATQEAENKAQASAMKLDSLTALVNQQQAGQAQKELEISVLRQQLQNCMGQKK